MSVRKMRDITEAETPTAEPLDPDNLRRAFEVSAFALALARRKPRRGVQKFASIEEARAARDLS